MNFSELFENIKERFSNGIENIKDYVQENTKQAILICSCVICVFVLLILIIVLASKPKEMPQVQEVLVLTDELLPPPSPVMPKGYTLSRQTKEKWTEEDLDSWFTIPSDKEIENLSSANDKLVTDIIGAAP